MSLTTTEEALVRELLAQQAAILSLAENEATIQSKLGATKVTLSDLTSATALADTDLLLVRQGTSDKRTTGALLKTFFAEAFTGSNVSLSANGHQKLPSGLIIQWGSIGPSANLTLQSITFPISFPNVGLMVNITSGGSATNQASAWRVSGPSATGFTYAVNNGAGSTAMWFSIGY